LARTFIPNARRKNTKANPDIFRRREGRCWTSEEEMKRYVTSKQAAGAGHELEEKRLILLLALGL
jgi:hypothetical protein